VHNLVLLIGIVVGRRAALTGSGRMDAACRDNSQWFSLPGRAATATT